VIRIRNRGYVGGAIALGGALAAVVTILVAPGAASTNNVNAQLASVRQATAHFHDLDTAEDAGYAKFLDCFDSPQGGMGQHFANQPLLSDKGKVDPAHPEVLVYEPAPSGYKLVAVEYVVPGPADMPNVPSLFGQKFTYNSALGVWKLHAWVWRHNPSGMFADWNPKVSQCPSANPVPSEQQAGQQARQNSAGPQVPHGA
jgi:hypothetical protein